MADADLSEGERTVLILNPHWKTVLWPFVLLVAVAVVAAVLLIVIPHNRLQGAERIAVGTVASEIANAPRGLKRIVFCCFSPDSAEHHRNAFAELELA